MFCANCGTKAGDGEHFCASCGTKFGAPQAENNQNVSYNTIALCTD